MRMFSRGVLFASIVVMLISCQSEKQRSLTITPVRYDEVQGMMHTANTKVTLVNIWASWCDPCKEEIPDLLKLRQMYGEKGLNVVLISADDVDEIDSILKPMLGQLNVDFPTYIINDSSDDVFIEKMSSSWNGALPASFIYDHEGNLIEMYVGKQSYATFEKVVKPLM